MRLRPACSKRRGTSKNVNCEALRDPQKLQEYQGKCNQLIQEISEAATETPSEKRDNFARCLLNVAQYLLGNVSKKHRDWFSDNDDAIRALLQETNKAHEA